MDKMVAVTVDESCEIFSGVEEVWALVSNTDRDEERWGAIRDVKVTKMEGNTIEREATVGPRGHRTKQTLLLDPKRSIQLRFTGDGLAGQRDVSLVPLGERDTRVDVSWRLEVSGVPSFVQELVKRQISRSTQGALKSFKEEAEQRRSGSAVGLDDDHSVNPAASAGDEV
jgi:carbon monoxide dehydrogenase subunit G